MCCFPLCHEGSCFIFSMFYGMGWGGEDGGWKAQRECGERRCSVDSPGRCCCLPCERRVDTPITPTPLQPERCLGGWGWGWGRGGGGSAAIPDSPHNSCLPQASEMCCLPYVHVWPDCVTCDLFYVWGRGNVQEGEGPLLLCLEGDWTDFLSITFLAHLVRPPAVQRCLQDSPLR